MSSRLTRQQRRRQAINRGGTVKMPEMPLRESPDEVSLDELPQLALEIGQVTVRVLKGLCVRCNNEIHSNDQGVVRAVANGAVVRVICPHCKTMQAGARRRCITPLEHAVMVRHGKW